MLSRHPLLLAPLLALLACGHAPPAPDDPGAADFYRQRLAESPKGKRAVEYRDALEGAEFASARRKGTILGFRTFLSEFPDGPHQREARTLLEALRWSEASAAGTLLSLQGFLADEPQGAHAGEAWARIAGLQLDEAEKSGSAPALRSWLGAHPDDPRRARAEEALAAAGLAEAKAAPLWRRRALLQELLVGLRTGPLRAEAESLEAATAVAEAAALGELDELRAWARSGRADAAAQLGQLELEEAAARLDLETLRELARAQGGPEARPGAAIDRALADRAGALLLSLQRLGARAKPLIEAARALYLPAAPVAQSDAPQGPREEARAILAEADRLDDRSLPALLAALDGRPGWPAVVAAQATLRFLESLPADVRRLRGARAATALQPLAQDGPHLAALALALFAEGELPAALGAARTAAAREPRALVVQLIASHLELAAGGDRALAQGSVRGLIAAARAALAARPESSGSAPGAAAAEGEASPTVWALCAALRAAEVAGASVAALPAAAPDDPAQAGLSADAGALLADAARALGAAERLAHKEGACRAELARVSASGAVEASARARAAALLSKAGEPASAALARARARDPAPAVRALLAAPAWPGLADLAPAARASGTVAP